MKVHAKATRTERGETTLWAQGAPAVWRRGRKEDSVNIKQDTHRRIDPPDRALTMRDTCVIHRGNERGDDGR